jgi:hypothetical protein
MKNGIAAPLLDIGSILPFMAGPKSAAALRLQHRFVQDLLLVRVEPPSLCDMKSRNTAA